MVGRLRQPVHAVNREGVRLKVRANERADLDIVTHVAANQRSERVRPLRATGTPGGINGGGNL